MNLQKTGDFDADVLANAKQLLGDFEVMLRSDPGQWAVLEGIWNGKQGQRAAKEREPAGTLQ
jgi:hypothetical protein